MGSNERAVEELSRATVKMMYPMIAMNPPKTGFRNQQVPHTARVYIRAWPIGMHRIYDQLIPVVIDVLGLVHEIRMVTPSDTAKITTSPTMNFVQNQCRGEMGRDLQKAPSPALSSAE